MIVNTNGLLGSWNLARGLCTEKEESGFGSGGWAVTVKAWAKFQCLLIPASLFSVLCSLCLPA